MIGAEVIGKDTREIAVVTDKMPQFLQEHTAFRVEIPLKQARQFAAEVARPGQQQFPNVSDYLVPRLLDRPAIELPAGVSQRENTDSECHAGITGAAFIVRMFSEFLQNLRIGNLQV